MRRQASNVDGDEDAGKKKNNTEKKAAETNQWGKK